MELDKILENPNLLEKLDKLCLKKNISLGKCDKTILELQKTHDHELKLLWEYHLTTLNLHYIKETNLNNQLNMCLDKLNKRKYLIPKHLALPYYENNKMCSICLNDIKLDRWKLLVCGHSLCENCLDKIKLCPQCRKPVKVFRILFD